MSKIPHIKAGEEISASFLNAIAERLERAVNLRTDSPYIRMVDSPHGKSIALAIPRPTRALLSGNASPYSWVEVDSASGGTWVPRASGDSGEAYEVNGKTNLDGKVVKLHWTAAGDWRFAWVGHGTPAPPACSGTICVQVLRSCNSAVLSGATVELIQGGVTIDTETSFSQVVSLTRIAQGSGYTPGTGYALGFSGGGATTPATGTFDVSSGGVVQNLVLTSGGVGYTSNPTVTTPGAGGSGAVVTAFVASYACFHSVPHGSGYTLRASTTGYIPKSSASFTVPPCTNKAAISLVPSTNTLRVVDVSGCPGPIAGIEVTAEQDGSSQTGTTDASGDVTFPSPFLVYDAVEQPYPITITFTDPEGRYVEESMSHNLAGCTTPSVANATAFTPSTCAGGESQGDVAAGYFCLPFVANGCGPVSKSLSCNDPVHGAVTLSFTGCKPDSSGGDSPHWEGDLTVSIPSCGPITAICSPHPNETVSCPAVSLDLHYMLNGTGLHVSFLIHDELCPTSGVFGFRCLGGGLNQQTSLYQITAGELDVDSCPPALLITGPLVNIFAQCVNPWGGATGTFSITEA